MKPSIRLFEEAEEAKDRGELARAANLYRQAACECDSDAAFRIAAGKAEEIEEKIYAKG